MNNIRYIFLTLCLVLIALPASAQMGEQRYNLSVGVNAGMNYNTVNFAATAYEPIPKLNGLMGINAGLTARYISEKYFSMICGAQVELNFSQRGWDEKFEEGDTRSYVRRMNYIEMPFLAHLAFGKDRGLQFFLNLGPQLGFMIGDSETFGGSWTTDQKNSREEYGKKIDNKFDYGIAGGAGFELRTKAGNFLVEGRYYFGLADFYNSSKKDYFSRSANSSIIAKVSYLFDLSK